MIWTQAKGYVREKNTVFKTACTERLTHEAMARITILGWEDCGRHTENLHEDFCK
jgi:hypothetical protein